MQPTSSAATAGQRWPLWRFWQPLVDELGGHWALHQSRSEKYLNSNMMEGCRAPSRQAVAAGKRQKLGRVGLSRGSFLERDVNFTRNRQPTLVRSRADIFMTSSNLWKTHCFLAHALQAAVYWQTYDAFARVSMSVGINQLMLGMSYYILGPWPKPADAHPTLRESA